MDNNRYDHHQHQWIDGFKATAPPGADSWSYRAGKVLAVLELTEEVSNEEAAKHEAHAEQGSVGVRPLDLQLVDCDVPLLAVLDVLHDDGVERVVQCAVQMFVVQDQRVGFEDLSKEAERRCQRSGAEQQIVVNVV